MKSKNLLYIAFSLLFALSACTKDQTTSDDQEQEKEQETNLTFDSDDYLYFVSGKMNGEEFIYGQREDDTKLEFQLLGGGLEEGATCVYYSEDGLDGKASYSSSIYPNFDEEDIKPSFGFYFDRFYRCNDPQEFNTLFPVEDYNFSLDDQPLGEMKEIGMGYSPTVNGDSYYTSYGNEQPQSTFKITVSETDNTIFGSAQMIEGEFSVTLYPKTGDAEPLEITDGKFKIRVSR